MTHHHTQKAAVQAYRRLLERLEDDARLYATLALEHAADLAPHLPPEDVLDEELETGKTRLVTDLWVHAQDVSRQLATVIASAHQARGLRRGQRRNSPPDAEAVWQQLRALASRRGELERPRPPAEPPGKPTGAPPTPPALAPLEAHHASAVSCEWADA